MSSVITEYAPSETGQDVDIFSLVAKGGRNPEDPARWHAMLLSYFDDSSDGKHRYYFAVGGLVGPESQWSDFHAPWALATKNLKEPFRSTECECQEGQFKGWDKSDCDALMDRLVSIVLDQRIHGYASVVPIATYKSVFPNCDEYDPYYLAIRHSIINMGELGHKEQRLRGTGGMKCWFEDSTATRGKTRLIYEALQRIHGYASVVPIATYKSGFPNCDEYDPYYLAIRHSIINMGELGHKEQRLRGTGGMKCWFEDSTATRGKTRL